MKLLIRGFVGIILLLVLATTQAQAKKSVAVLNFANYGGKGMNYLSNALPESISASLSEIDDIKVVERRNLGKVVDEMALQQSGLVDSGKVKQAGKLSRADVLILGSISGNPSQIILTLKAVQVSNGKILDGRVVKAPLAEIFDNANQAARSMAAIISGRGIGRLSVSSTPQNAKVYIDGLFIGTTPLVEHKITIGKHRIKIAKSGYLEYDESVTIKVNSHESVTTRLGEEKVTDRMFIGALFGYNYLFNSDINYGLQGGAQIGYTFDRFMLAGEFLYGYIDNTQTFDDNDIKDRVQWYTLWNFAVHINYVVYRSTFVAPYVGGFIGYTRFFDYREDTNAEDEKEEVRNQNSLVAGATLGINFIPYSRVNPFIECRFYYFGAGIEHEKYETFNYFTYIDKTERIHLMGLLFNAGIRISF